MSKLFIKERKSKGFSLIELIVVLSVLSILSAVGVGVVTSFIRKAERAVAKSTILSIKAQCESNRILNDSLDFHQVNLMGYLLDADESNNCNGNPNHGFITLFAKGSSGNPSFHYEFKSGALSCSLGDSLLTPFPECKRLDALKKKYRCGDIGDWSRAQELLNEGHSYLDRDNDGQACETLGRRTNRPKNGLVTIENCYDGDTCTTTDGERVRLACIDTPELLGKRANPLPAKAARDYLNQLIKGQEIEIRRVTEDRYGRTVGELSLDGVNLQQQLIAEGHAKIYTKYSKPCSWANN